MNAHTDQFSPFFTLAGDDDVNNGATAAAYARGHEDGSRSAEAATGHRIAGALDALLSALHDTAGDAHARMVGLEHECARLATIFARLLGAGLAPPQTRIEAAMRLLLDDLVDQPTIRLTVASNLAETLEPRIGEMLRAHGLASKVIMVRDAEMPPGDAHIEWRGGCLRLDRAAVEETIAAHVRRAFPEISEANEDRS